MKKFLLAFFCCAGFLTSQAAIYYYAGDANDDGNIDVSDVTAIINNILGNDQNSFDAVTADVNLDGKIDVSDITDLVNIILSGKEYKTDYDYVWDYDALPEIHITVSLDEWNRLLNMYDANKDTKQYVRANGEYRVNGDRILLDSLGLRLKGNTSRRRPEGDKGQMHSADNTDWHHVHFGLKFDKYFDDTDHTLNGIKKIHLKWFNNDPTYIREMYSYDLFRRAGVWTAIDDTYCRLWLKVEGDSKETYYGVYELMEPIDKQYLKRRKTQFGSNKGYLWKCAYGATLASTNADFYYDDNSDDDHVYTLENSEELDSAKAQIQDFMLKLTGKGNESFAKWIKEVCDVDLLLKTYAVNVTLGMWDDYWNNCNNYYIYFNSKDRYDYKFYFIPYDYDNTLGTSNNCGVQSDAGRQDPLKWGADRNPLIKRVLDIDEYKAKYIQYMKELVNEEAGLFHYTASKERIKAWQQKIASYVYNETGEDMSIYDQPASWGNHSEYRVLEDGANNFFRVKTSVIEGL